MRVRFDFKGLRFFLAITRSKEVEGVNSKLPDGWHFLMWDFDEVEEGKVIFALLEVQRFFKLSSICIISTGIPNHHHAYCFTKASYPTVLSILASTEGLDQMYFKIGVIRGYFTLRISDKKDRVFQPRITLASPVPPDINPSEIASFITYWTKRI